ncbi:hypothetical protein pipiens_006996 [Culex pipiens pipiens]|uniref:Uncharacterized protein n=1 Tax=Culex pipiens pipiens TaxID=38569 RepID=A0ABD1DNI3_CULPP
MRPHQYKNGDCCSGVVVATMARTANGWESATERSVRERRRPRRHDLGFMAGLVALLVATVVAATGLMGAGASRVFDQVKSNATTTNEDVLLKPRLFLPANFSSTIAPRVSSFSEVTN